MKKLVSIFFGFLFCFSCKDEKFINTDYECSKIVFYNISNIPNNIMSTLNYYEKTKLEFANNDEDFQSNDIKFKGSKDKKINFIVKCNNDFIISYIQGGFVKYNVIYKITIVNEDISKVQKSISKKIIPSFEVYKSMIKKESVIFETCK